MLLRVSTWTLRPITYKSREVMVFKLTKSVNWKNYTTIDHNRRYSFSSVEDEMHFLFECPTYKDQRSRFLVPITSQIHNFSFLPRDQKFELVMCSMDENVCNFISNSMEIREFLMSKPRVYA